LIDSSDGVQQAGEVAFKRLELISNDGVRHNLISSFTDFTLYEDLFSPILTGYVLIVDAHNLISTLPILGGERLVVEFKTPGRDSIELSLRITKIGHRDHANKKNVYTLEFISPEGFEDLNVRVSKSFSGNTSALVKRVYKEYFKSNISDADLSDTFVKFVSPYWGPLKIINHITTLATYPNNKILTPNYLFYISIRMSILVTCH